jgi:hypothetical protein
VRLRPCNARCWVSHGQACLWAVHLVASEQLSNGTLPVAWGQWLVGTPLVYLCGASFVRCRGGGVDSERGTWVRAASAADSLQTQTRAQCQGASSRMSVCAHWLVPQPWYIGPGGQTATHLCT